MNFYIDNLHYLDKKLVNEQPNDAVEVDWKSILTERKKQFSNHCFIVIEKDQPLLIDTILLSFIKLDKTKKSISINIDTSLKEDDLKLYILQLHQKEQNLIINIDGEYKTTIFHENIVCHKGQCNFELNNKSKISYYSIFTNLTKQLFHQKNFIHNYGQMQLYLMQNKDKETKNKIDTQVNLYKNSSINAFYLTSLDQNQLRDDTVEFVHQEDNAISNISYLSLNGAKSISQINSVVLKNVINSETHQHIKHILLNEDAQSYSKPNLMINNNLVVASHGNSIGSINLEDLFYLNQRGINTQQARQIIANSYMKSFCDKTDYSEQIFSYLYGDFNESI